MRNETHHETRLSRGWLTVQAEEHGRRTGCGPCQLILVVIPQKPSDLYREAKFLSDVKIGVPSQCVVARNAGIGCMPKRRDQYCSNLVLKINAKLGTLDSGVGDELSRRCFTTPAQPLDHECSPYIHVHRVGAVCLVSRAIPCRPALKPYTNQSIPPPHSWVAVRVAGGTNSVIKTEGSTFDKDPQKALSWFVARPFMIFGADVTHPTAGSRAPSVAAVVGSLTKSATRYATRVLVQERRKDKVGHPPPLCTHWLAGGLHHEAAVAPLPSNLRKH
jgi:hypothetical protein